MTTASKRPFTDRVSSAWFNNLCYSGDPWTHELQLLGVEAVTLESRGPKDDARDAQTLDFMRRSRSLSGARLHMKHQPGPADPLLWVPDIICGAVTRQRLGDPSYLQVLRAKVELISIDTKR